MHDIGILTFRCTEERWCLPCNTSELVTLHSLLPSHILIHQITTKTRRHYLEKLFIFSNPFKLFFYAQSIYKYSGQYFDYQNKKIALKKRMKKRKNEKEKKKSFCSPKICLGRKLLTTQNQRNNHLKIDSICWHPSSFPLFVKTLWPWALL